MNSTETFSLKGLGLGTSRLGHHHTKAEALYTLDLAFDHGVSYFDTAPIYAYGWSEKLVGTFAHHKRDKIQIATKIGLQPSAMLSMLPFGILSSIRQITIKVKKKNTMGLPAGVSRHKSFDFDQAWAMQSLEKSLKRLKTDYVDVLLLHESTIAEANGPQTIQFMARALQSGKARSIGIGSELEKLEDIATLHPEYRVVQHEYNLCHGPISKLENRMINIHGVFQNVDRINSLRQKDWFKRNININQLDFKKKADVISFCLAGAKYENPSGMTLFSSSNNHHIKETISSWKNIPIDRLTFDQSIAIIRKHIQAT